jgi:hypothetical protein
MAKNTSPIFALNPHFAQAQITDVTTDKTGATTANIETLYTVPAGGSKITEIGYKFEGTSVAGLFLVWITDTGGANPRLYQELTIAAATSSTTVACNSNYALFDDLQLEEGQEIWVAITTISGTVYCNAYCKVGDFE